MHLHRDRGELDYIIGEVAKPLVGFHSQMDENRKECKRSNTSDMLNLSLESNRFSRDLLHRFMESGSSRQKEFVKREEEEEEGEDLELNLGLSLGGRFGVDKTKLVRSSSIASLLPVTRDDDALTPPASVYPPLARTSSLPVETEEEWRKRKEMQSLRRMEAKRRRFEKQRNVRAEREAGGGGGSGCGSDGGGGGGSSGSGGVEEERRESDVNSKQQFELLAAKKFETSMPSPCRLNKLNGASRQASLGSGIDLEIAKGKGSFVGAGGGSNGGQPFRQGSVESQGGGLLSISAELESKPLRGSSSGSDMSPASSRKSRPGTESPAKGTDTARNRSKETGTQEIQDMPCVFTKGHGPNGRRVDGILYKYGKGEEVKIMCVCHGCFLSPAEFVKHAGLINVSHPLKHIVIVPNHPSF